MSRGALAGLIGVLVLGVVLGIAFFMGKDGSSASSSPSSTTSTTSSQGGGTPSNTPAPSLPSSGGSAVVLAPTEGQNPRDYVVGDIRVHDHRSGDNKPLDIPPNVHPAEGPEIPSTLTHEVAQKVKAVMMTCAKDNLPQDARGEKPRLEGQISISIKDHKVTIQKSTMQLRDVNGPAVDAMKSCVETRSVGLENPAPDQADLEDYTINVTFAIPG